MENNQAEPNPPVPQQTPKRPRLLKILLILVLVAAIGFGGWYGYNQWHNKSSSSSLPANWSEYKNDKYGFKFSYPKNWGTPQLLQSPDQNGAQYQISFSAPNKSIRYSTVVSFDSTPAGLKKNNIEEVLSSQDKSQYVKYDVSSYAILFKDPTSKIPPQLIIYQIVSLQKINVSAVVIEAMVDQPDSQCPTNKLADSSVKNCITDSIYETVNKFAKSIHSL